MKKVAIIMGEPNDWEYAKTAARTLRKFKVPFTANVISAYRTPARSLEFSGRAMLDDFGVIITVSGPTAHLSAAMAASTLLPVIAVPVRDRGRTNTEAWFAYAQTPVGVPVATVGIEACENAALLAVQILAVNDAELAGELAIYKQELTDELVEADFLLQQEIEQL